MERIKTSYLQPKGVSEDKEKVDMDFLQFKEDKDIIDANWTVHCNGAYRYGDRTFHCWNKNGHGHVDLTQSIKYSCNIFYYQLNYLLQLINA
jgi:cell division protein FtsI/penicillin-binding protein 2